MAVSLAPLGVIILEWRSLGLVWRSWTRLTSRLIRLIRLSKLSRIVLLLVIMLSN